MEKLDLDQHSHFALHFPGYGGIGRGTGGLVLVGFACDAKLFERHSALNSVGRLLEEGGEGWLIDS